MVQAQAKTIPLPLVSPGYLGRSPNISAQRMINLYPEMVEGKEKDVAALIGTPGTSLWSNVGAGPVRGFHVFNSLLYAVIGGYLYSITNAGVSTQIGNAMTTSAGRVVMADNGLKTTGGSQLAIADGQHVYIWAVDTNTWTQTSIAAYTVAFIDGFFVADIGGMQFQVSALYDGTTWSALDKSAAQAYPDNLVACVNHLQQIWFFGSYHTEIWYDAGAGHPVLSPIQGAVSMYGLAARYSIVHADNSLFWLANQYNNDQGELFGFVRANGYVPQSVTPPSIMYAWSKYSTVSDAFTYSYTDEGHTFIVLTFPTANATWVYDCSAKFWHERSSYLSSGDALDGRYVIGRHLSNCYAYFNGMHLVGDYASGNVYKMSSSVYQDAGYPIVRDRIFRHIQDNGNTAFFHRVRIDGETGVGDNNLVTNPQASLCWSDDGGHTWGNECYTGMGDQGQYKTRMVWDGLGASKDRVFWLRISDPVKVVLTTAKATVTPGYN